MSVSISIERVPLAFTNSSRKPEMVVIFAPEITVIPSTPIKASEIVPLSAVEEIVIVSTPETTVTLVPPMIAGFSAEVYLR